MAYAPTRTRGKRDPAVQLMLEALVPARAAVHAACPTAPREGARRERQIAVVAGISLEQTKQALADLMMHALARATRGGQWVPTARGRTCKLWAGTEVKGRIGPERKPDAPMGTRVAETAAPGAPYILTAEGREVLAEMQRQRAA